MNKSNAKTILNDNGAKKAWKTVINNYLLCFCIVALVIVTMIIQPSFLTIDNLVNIIRQFGPLSLVSIGMTFVILAGYLDLSVAGIFSLVTVITASMIEPLGQVGALLAGLGVGVVAGLINGIIVQVSGADRKSEALFITFGIGLVYSASALVYSSGKTERIPSGLGLYEALGSGGIGVISYSFMIFVACLVILYIFQSKTYIGRSIVLAGGNPVASRLAGIPVNSVPVLVYGLSGLMTGLGAIVLLSRVTTAAPNIGVGYETNAITAVLIGGTSLMGGKGSVLRTALGVLLITLLSNCMNLLGVDSFVQNVVKGAILILAIWLDNRRTQ